MGKTRLATYLGTLALLGSGLAAAGDLDCGSLRNAYGPFDYTNGDDQEKHIRVIDFNHFNSDVETLKKGQSSVYIIDDLHYILRAVPNHHRALATMARYYLNGGQQMKGYSAECYFDRALRFKPDDGNVHLIFGMYLHRTKKYTEAEGEYRAALQSLVDSADAHYDLGLLYADIGRWPEAKEQALEAYRLGYPLPALKTRLVQHGLWSESDEAALAVATAPPPADDSSTKQN